VIDARAPDFEVISCGLHIAAMLEMPLPIRGHWVEVPAGFRVEPSEVVEDDTHDVAREAMDVLMVARDCAYLMRAAAAEIERLGVELGHFAPPPPRATISRPMNILPSVLAPRPEPPEPTIAEVAPDCWHVGGAFEVRSNDTGKSWTVYRLAPYEWAARHPNQLDAMRWAKQAANEAWRPGAGAAQTAGR
jgi:hypothetical protein